jgi:lauroyl/myristoyl acyltransferase
MRSLSDLRLAWGARPGSYTRVVWALILALDALPWPWGEEIMARCFVARALVRRVRFREALAWARAQPDSGRTAGRLARSICANHGRFVARSALVGMRDPDTVRRHVALRGDEHLAAAGPGAILLGFHLGPAQSYLALRALGHRLIWVGGRGASPAWSPAIRERYQRDHGDLLLPDVPYAWERRLYKARQILNEGRSVFISADGPGAVAFSVPLPGGSAAIGTGWLLLRQSTKAPVLPVLSHLEGRTQIVTVLPPLPPCLPDAARDREACRRAIAQVMGDHVRRFPEQCYSLVFGLPADEPAPARKPIRR